MTTDWIEIAAEPIPETGVILTCFATRDADGQPRLQLASMRVTKAGLQRPPSPLPLDPPSLAAAIRLAEQAEELVLSGAPWFRGRRGAPSCWVLRHPAFVRAAAGSFQPQPPTFPGW